MFRADLRTPRGVLQHCIDDLHQKLQSSDAKKQASALRFQKRFGSTVDDLLSSGWRVVELPTTALTDRGFRLTSASTSGHSIGHQDVEGDYSLHSGELAEIARVLSEQEYQEDP